ncbi:NAD-dependent epimerase/dehydratase family protein [candidate division KSB1 bacterium]
MLKDKVIFITGGAGFIGTALCGRFHKNNKIILYDNGHRNALQYFDFKDHENVTVIEGDILDKELLKKSVKNADIVIHAAAIAGVSSYYKMPLKTMQVNMVGTYTLLEVIREIDIELMMYFSTSEIYGPHVFRAHEQGETIQGDLKDARWTYSISKLAAEKLCYCYFWEEKVPFIAVRPFNVYGPGQVGEGAIQIFTTKALNNEDIIITGDGVQIRSWCYIDDFADAIEACSDRVKIVGNSFNIGNPQATVTILELANKVKNILGSQSNIVFHEHMGVDVQLRVPDISKAQKMLGFDPKVSLEEGLEKTINWYRENLKV